MSTMLRKLWDTTFHLESKFLRTCWQLFIPGKVTVEFFKGKQDRYPHPLRMFAIVMFLFLFMVNTLLKERESKRSDSMFTVSQTVNTEHGDSIVNRSALPYYEQVKYRLMLNDMRKDYETMPTAWKTLESRKAVDSLLRKYNQRHGLEDTGLLDSIAQEVDSTNFGLFGKYQVRLATLDLVRYEPDDLLDRYKVEDWPTRLFIRQTVKSYKNPDGFVHAYIGSMTWTILAQVTVMAAILYLLYWRRQRYYVEHFIFLLHYHTGLMLALLMILIGVLFQWWHWFHLFWAFPGSALFMYMSMRRYYGQGWGKTLLKWSIFGLLYYISLVTLFTLGTILVFAVF